MNDGELLQHLMDLELALMQPARRRDAAWAAEVLHPLAHEVGRSGRSYDRAALLALLAQSADEAPDAVRAHAFVLDRLSPDAALLRYRSERAGLATARSSLWQLHEGHWRLRYHQGTPCA